jgi:hypothetical protein
MRGAVKQTVHLRQGVALLYPRKSEITEVRWRKAWLRTGDR